MAGSVNAASIYITGSGNWTTSSLWSTGTVPVATAGDELKLCSSGSDTSVDNMVVTINSNVGSFTLNTAKISITRNTILQIVDGGYIGYAGTFIVGRADTSNYGTDNGYVVQTGGTVQLAALGVLSIGYAVTGSGSEGGVYTISGGSILGSSSGTNASKIIIGASGLAGSKGKLKIVGTGGTISTGTLFIGNKSSTASSLPGTGTLEFELDSSGAVSKVQAGAVSIDALNTGVANLIVDLTGSVPTSDLLLVENTGTDSVVGDFDTLNGGSAVEGDTVVLGGTTFTLTYKYIGGTDGVANDIALVIPEPTTMALLGLGLLVIRRKK